MLSHPRLSETDVIVHVQTMSTLVKSVGNFHSGTSFWSFCFDSFYISEFCDLPAWWSVPSRTVIYLLLFSFACFVFFFSSQQQYSQINPFAAFSPCNMYWVLCCFWERMFQVLFTLQVWVSAWKLKIVFNFVINGDYSYIPAVLKFFHKTVYSTHTIYSTHSFTSISKY